MQLNEKIYGKYLIIKSKGRLDANWSEYFNDYFLDLIRQGKHYLIVDAAEMEFLSSAGIRSLVRIAKELQKVKGSFGIFQATEFVAKTIEMTGFKSWMLDVLPEPEVAGVASDRSQKPHLTYYEIQADSALELTAAANWKFPEKLNKQSVDRIRFDAASFALGIGSPDDHTADTFGSAGEFLVVSGQVIFQPPELKSKPDFLLSEGDFVPELNVLQALAFEGAMRGLIRFNPPEGATKIGLSELAHEALQLSGASTAALLILAETDGLVGAQLINNPANLNDNDWPEFPQIREWLAFSGERVFATKQVLVFGVVSKEDENPITSLLHPLPSSEGLKGHFHGAVFPYQPLQNGVIELKQSIMKFLNGPPPQALLHLIDDNRAAGGLGESGFVRGACWFSPINLREVIL